MNKSATDIALEWKAEQEAQGIIVTDEDYQQTLNAITYELQHQYDLDQTDYDTTAGE